MSRTIRRNQTHLIQRCLGTRDDNVREPWWLMYRYPTCTFEQAWKRAKARFHRDHNPAHYGVPRWYRVMHGAHHNRRQERAKIHHHLRLDCWESHLPESRCRGMNWFF